MNKYMRIYEELIRVKEFEDDIRTVCGEITPARRQILDERYKDAKRNVRDALDEIKDPLEKSIMKGSKRSFYHSERLTSFWLEYDCTDETDEEVENYVRAAYEYYGGPGEVCSEVSWKRTEYGLLIVTTLSRDI